METGLWGMKIVEGNIICPHNKGYILQRHKKIYYTDDKLGNQQFLFSLKRNRKNALISKFGRLGERFIRSDIKAGTMFEGKLYFSDLGICYSYDFRSRKLTAQHKHRMGMRCPLNYCKIENIQGFDDQICYGDYFGNEGRDSVNIWHKVKGSDQWEVAASFEAGEVRHIHGIFVDGWRKCAYILTGDTDEESAIWIARDNFKDVHKLVAGNQQARSCQMKILPDGFLYCTDSEREENALYDVKILDNEPNIQRKKIKEIEGSIIYGVSTEDRFIFSTTVEPDKGGIRSKHVRVYSVDYKNGKICEIFKAQKDLFPMKIFQFGCARINVSMGTIGLSLCGVKKYDGKTVIIDLISLNKKNNQGKLVNDMR